MAMKACAPAPEPGVLAQQMATTTQRRSWVLVLVGAIVMALLTLPLYRAVAAGGQSNDVATQLKQLKAQLADVKASQASLQKALDAANAALNQAENELAAANADQLAAQVQAKQAAQLMVSAKKQVARLRQVVGDQARDIYINGVPASLEILVQNDNVQELLNQVTILDHLARQNHDNLSDMLIAQKEYAAARLALQQARKDAQRAAVAIQHKIAQAQQLRDLRTKAMAALLAKVAQIAGKAAALRLAQQQAAEQASGVQLTAGGLCDLSGTSAAERWIIMHESGGNPRAQNPHSTAFGLGQLLLDLRIRLLGADFDTIDCGKQLWAFRQYVRERYGTAEAAQAFWEAHGWY
jgi:septal ring factor EnvC (AmiA/AmiB activator)